MKHLYLLLLLLLPSFSIFAQSFAPVGAEWHYGKGQAFGPQYQTTRMYVEKDTLLLGKMCTKLVKVNRVDCFLREEVDFFYSPNDSVWLYDPHFDIFQLMVDYSAQANDSWTYLRVDNPSTPSDTYTVTVVVDSTATTVINGFTLNVLHLTGNFSSGGTPLSFSTTVTQKLGGSNYLFFADAITFGLCDGDFSLGLRCYEDNQIGFHSTGISSSCTATNVGIDEQLAQNDFKIFPNPANHQVLIQGNTTESVQFELVDLTGRLILSDQFVSSTALSLSSLQAGIYLLSLHRDGFPSETQRLIVQ